MLKPVILKGSLVQLEPMTIDHTQALCEAASENRRTYAYTHVPDGIEETKRYIERALSDYEKGLALPFAVRSLETERIIGSTRFMDAEVFTRPADAARKCVRSAVHGMPLPYSGPVSIRNVNFCC